MSKKGRGRRKGGISEAARKLPVQGKTHAAKRKNVERALKVDSIFPEAKDAIKKAGLYQNSIGALWQSSFGPRSPK